MSWYVSECWFMDLWVGDCEFCDREIEGLSGRPNDLLTDLLTDLFLIDVAKTYRQMALHAWHVVKYGNHLKRNYS